MADWEKGGVTKTTGRKTWRFWVRYRGRQITFNTAPDGSRLDTEEKAQALLEEARRQIKIGMFDPKLWRSNSVFKTEWEIRQLSPSYDRVGICGICGEKTNICQDHDHMTGLIRGKLCRNCNFGIGVLKENKETLVGALKYLMFWEKQGNNRPTFEEWQAKKDNIPFKKWETYQELTKAGYTKDTCIHCGRELVDGKCLCGRRQSELKKTDPGPSGP